MRRQCRWTREIQTPDGQTVSEVDYVTARLADWPENRPLMELARQLQKELPPLPNGHPRSISAINMKLNRLCQNRQAELNRPAEPGQIAPPAQLPGHARPLVEEIREPIYDLDRWMRAVRELRQLYDAGDPIITHATVHIEIDAPIALQIVSDFHWGGRYTAYEEFQKLSDFLMETDRVYWGVHGDEIENFMLAFRNARAVFDQLIAPPRQVEVMRRIIARLAQAGKLMYACRGNHPAWHEQAVGQNPIKDAYLEGGVPFFDGKGLLRLIVGKADPQEYLLALAHEFPGYSMYNRNHAQSRAHKWDFPSADVVAMGDKHTMSVQFQAAYVQEFDAGLRPWPYVYYVQTGTSKDGSDPYSITGWSRGVFNWPVLVFRHDEHWIDHVTRLDELEYYLSLGVR